MLRAFIIATILFIPSLCEAFSQTELIARLQAPQNLQGDFVQQRYMKSLAKPITTSGQFYLAKNQGLLWQMQKPFTSLLKVSPQGIAQWNGQSWQYNSQLGQTTQIQLFLGLLSGDFSGLTKEFDFALSSSSQQWTLTLTPKSLLMKQIFNQIQLQGKEVVEQVELLEKQGDRTLILFDNIKQNIDFTEEINARLAE